MRKVIKDGTTKTKLLLIWVTFVLFVAFITSGASTPFLKIVVCDVGQGDAILLEYLAWRMLIDTGPDDSVVSCLDSHIPFWDKTIDVLVLTHWDLDHVGGATRVINEYKVIQTITNGREKSSSVAQEVQTLLESKKIPVMYANQQTWRGQNGPSFNIVWPEKIQRKNLSSSEFSEVKTTSIPDSNDASIVIKGEFRHFTALFTGDIEKEVEKQLATRGKHLSKSDSIDVLKVGHHGSNSSTTREFLEFVRPNVSIISAGQGNKFNHPHPDVISRLNSVGSNILRTDEDGEIQIYTDGYQAWYHTSMQDAKQSLAIIIKEVMSDLRTLPSLGIEEIESSLFRPVEHSFGDWTSNLLLVNSKEHKSNPLELGKKVAQAINDKNSEILEKTECTAPGFLNFTIAKKEVFNAVLSMSKKPEAAAQDPNKKQKYLVEFSSPNIAKPFTIGHLRSTIIGDTVARILEYSGHEVIRDNHLGDWGTQFGKQISAIKRWGDEQQILQSVKPIKELVDLYVKFHKEVESSPELEDEARAWLLKLEQGDSEARRLWQLCIDLSLKEFQTMYDQLDIRFDTMLGESFYEKDLPGVLQDVEQLPQARESDGALLIFFDDQEQYAHLPPLMVRRSDGATLYATRDLAAAKYRKMKYGEDLFVINEVGAEQNLYFQQVFAAEHLLGYSKPGMRFHLSHGMIRFKERKMSTRKGDVVWLDELVAQVIEKAGEVNPSVAAEVGIGALKYNDLKREAKKDVLFDLNEMLSLKGNSGPYLQYSYARACSVLDKAESRGITPQTEIAWKNEYEDEIRELERLLIQFPEVVQKCATEFAPHHLCTFLFELAQAFNTYYAEHRILGNESEQYRVRVTAAVANVLQTGLHLLGIQTPQSM